MAGAWSAGPGFQTACLRLILSSQKVEETHHTFGCTIEILRPRWTDLPEPLEERVRIRRHGRLVFDSEMPHPSAGAAWIGNGRSKPSPAIWVRSDSGGSGGYSETWVFDLEGDGGFLPRLHLENGWFEEATRWGPGSGTGPGTTHRVHPRDGGAVPAAPSEWRQPVLGFRYWLTSGAGSPAPLLKGWLDWSKGFVIGPAPDAAASTTGTTATTATTPVARALAEIATAGMDLESVQTSSDAVFSPLLRVYLDLVFEGRAREAAEFLRDAHRGGLARVLESGAVSDLPRSLEAFEAMLHARILEEEFHWVALERNGGALVSVRDLDE